MASRWVRKRSPKVVAAEKRAHVREVRAYARGTKTLRTSSPKMQAQHGRVFPPAVAAKTVRSRTAYFANRVADRSAGVFRDRLFQTKAGVKRRRAR